MSSQNSHSILIVEDERIVANDLQQALCGMGDDAYAIASSGDEAIARASERRPDVVLMDIRIKGPRDGIQTAEILRRQFDVPVVYLTAHADEATIERATKTEPPRSRLQCFVLRTFGASSTAFAGTFAGTAPVSFPRTEVTTVSTTDAAGADGARSRDEPERCALGPA